jgi:hypothetical protein
LFAINLVISGAMVRMVFAENRQEKGAGITGA